MDRIEYNISQLRHDIDSIVECTNKMVEMTKLSLRTSSDSNKKIETIKKKLSELKHSAEESEMYMEHLNKRIIKLENNCETPSMDTNSEYFPSNSGSNNTEEYFVFDSDFSLNPEINNSMISNQISPGPLPSTNINTSSPCLTQEEIRKIKYHQE